MCDGSIIRDFHAQDKWKQRLFSTVLCLTKKGKTCKISNCAPKRGREEKEGVYNHETTREFSSRLGFLLISAGCAIGLGNVWRFPYITGQYGGAAFVVVYLMFLIIMGLPVMVMEFSVGRASQKSMAGSFQALEPKGTRWHWYSWFGLAGNYLLMMFCTSVSGWLIFYCIKMAKGDFTGLDTAGVSQEFSHMLAQPGLPGHFYGGKLFLVSVRKCLKFPRLWGTIKATSTHPTRG